MLIPKIKICCISSIQEAELAIKYGASAIGLVSEMPSGPGVISEELIKDIASAVPSTVDTFLLTSEINADSIIEQHRKCITSTLQIVDRVSIDVYDKLREHLPAIKLVQVIHVTDGDSVKEAVLVSKYVDALLLDSGNQKLEIKELGGTGRTHDWKISRKIRDAVSVPVYLAGGINAKNVLDAANQVEPFGIDLCSGVRENGKLSENLLGEFFSVLKNSDS